MGLRETLLDSVGIARQAHMYVVIFQDLQKEPDGIDTVRRYRSTIEPALYVLDRHMTNLVLSDELLTTMWASLMHTSAKEMATLDRILALPSRSHFQWEEITAAMALLHTIKVVFTLALQNEGIEIES